MQTLATAENDPSVFCFFYKECEMEIEVNVYEKAAQINILSLTDQTRTWYCNFIIKKSVGMLKNGYKNDAITNKKWIEYDTDMYLLMSWDTFWR